MKKRFLTLVSIPLLLASCGGSTSNPFADTAFSYESYTATYPEGYTEDTFFKDFLVLFPLKMKTFVFDCVNTFTVNEMGKTSDGCLHFSRQVRESAVKYLDKKVDAYHVNYEIRSEMEVFSFYSYIVENNSARFVLPSEEIGTYIDYVQTGFTTDLEKNTYTYLSKDTSVKIENNKLIMKMSLNFKITDGSQKVVSDRTAEATLTWAKK